jgi:hypothetical protein
MDATTLIALQQEMDILQHALKSGIGCCYDSQARLGARPDQAISFARFAVREYMEMRLGYHPLPNIISLALERLCQEVLTERTIQEQSHALPIKRGA